MLIRKTTLQSSREYELDMKGIVSMSLLRTDSGLLINDIELLTSSLNNVLKIVPHSMVDYMDYLPETELFYRTSIGVITYDENNINQLNSDYKVVTSIPIEVYTAMKLKANLHHNKEPGVLEIPLPFIRATNYGLTQLGINPNYIGQSLTHEGYTYIRQGEGFIKLSKSYEEDIKLIPKIYGKNELPNLDTVRQLIGHNMYVYISERKFVIWNSHTLQIEEDGVVNYYPSY